MPVFHAAQLENPIEGLLTAIGARPRDAKIVADHLLSCHLAGHDSHGLIRIPQYFAHAKEGRLCLDSAPTILQETPATAVMDGGWTWGQVTASDATHLAIQKATQVGVAAVTVRQCYHIGRVGVYALEAAKRGLVGKVWCNGHGVARVAPWGGCEPRLATNPIAIAIPTQEQPILVDITTSVVAEGKVRVAKNKGVSVPDGWLLDKDGNPTNNPADLYVGGSLLPFGGPVAHKGYGLSVVVDALGGVLSAAGCGMMPGVPIGNGLLIEILDPKAFGDPDDFYQRMQAYVDYLKSARPRVGVDEILLPGEPELRTEARRRVEGFEIDEETWRQINGVAAEVGFDLAAALN